MTGGLIRDSGSSWLIPLADLSLILFITTAASLSVQPAVPRRDEPPPAAEGIAQGVAAAVFVAGPGAPPLGQWLAQYRAGSGEQLTIEGYFLPQDRERIAAGAEDMAEQAIAAGFSPRLILQPVGAAGGQSHVRAVFAHDADPQVAQSLLQQEPS